VNRAHPYLPDKDKDLEEHVDALYKVVHTSPPAAATQALMLLFHVAVGSHLENTRPEKSATDAETGRQNRFYSALYASLSHEALLSSGKHLTMYFNLLYKAMKYDSDENRVHAFTKRIMCTALHCSPAVVSGSLFLLNELSKTHTELRKCFEEAPNGRDANVVLDTTKRDPRSALVVKGEEGQKSNSEDATLKHPPCWELALLTYHFHPSVNKFARTLGEITYAGDPLKDFGLAPFLDKFAYKNPKSKEKLANHYKRGESIAERRSGTDGAMQAHKSLPVNDPSFLRKDNVNEQDVFFQKFFVERARRDDIKGIVRGKPAMDEEEMEDVVMDAAEEAEGFDGGLEQTVSRGGVGTALSFLWLTLLFLLLQLQFEEYERGWETDEEEEAFVDKLAESLMEDALDDENDLEDEDPDMDDWGDLDDDDEEEENPPAKAVKGESDSDAVDDDDDDDDDEADEDEAAGVIDEDAFMDDDDEADEAAGVIDEDAFMDANENDDEGDSNDDSDADDLAFAGDGSDSDSDPEHAAMIKVLLKKGKKQKNSDVFADADDYEEKINKSWSEVKRPRAPEQEEDPADKEDEEDDGPSDVKETKSAKKRKRRKRGKQ
jgi:ribosome biogenesis protein MAK21